MNERDFLYWLNGFFELTESSDFTVEQAAKVNKHILLVLGGKHEPDSVIYEMDDLMRDKDYNGVKHLVDSKMLRLTNSDITKHRADRRVKRGGATMRDQGGDMLVC